MKENNENNQTAKEKEHKPPLQQIFLITIS